MLRNEQSFFDYFFQQLPGGFFLPGTAGNRQHNASLRAAYSSCRDQFGGCSRITIDDHHIAGKTALVRNPPRSPGRSGGSQGDPPEESASVKISGIAYAIQNLFGRVSVCRSRDDNQSPGFLEPVLTAG